MKTLEKPTTSLSNITVELWEATPLNEYPDTPFTRKQLNKRLLGCLQRAVELKEISLLGELLTGEKVYLKNNLVREKHLTATQAAVEMGIKLCRNGRNKGIGCFPAGQYTSNQAAVLEIITPERISSALKETQRSIRAIYKAAGLAARDIRTAWWSDGFGSIFASALANTLRKECEIDVRSGGNMDGNPDLIFPSVSLNVEIKTMTGDTSWQGGEYSNESRCQSPTLLVSRDHEFNLFWAGLVPATSWDSSMRRNQKRYATVLSWKWVSQNPYLRILCGEKSVDGKMVKKEL